jgi:hypothetical protein
MPNEAPKPIAWAVFMPRGHEYDFKLFTYENEAHDEVGMIEQDVIDGCEIEEGYIPEVTPLYPKWPGQPLEVN